jgi:hypothetical protein
MAFPQGINFRDTAGFVTDGANYDYIIQPYSGVHTAYPFTTAQGNVVGWEGTLTTVDSRDRDAGVDVRLAGINIVPTDSGAVFRVDLPSPGIYNIGFAAGDSNNQPVAWDLKDTTSLLAHLTTGTITSGEYKDATNTAYDVLVWPGSQTLVPFTFTTTILRLAPVGAGLSPVIASLYVAQVSASSTFVTSRMTIPLPAPRRTQVVMI